MMRIFLFFLLISGFSVTGHSQFYTGSQQEFGKNRVQYKGSFLWKVQYFQRFHLYYYPGGEALAEYAAKSFQNELDNMEAEFGVQFRNPMELIVFKSLADLRQSNIGIGREEESNIGASSTVFGSRLMIYYETDHHQLDIQIRRVLAEYLLNYLLYGEKWSDMLIANPLSSHPLWFIQGFASYYSEPWSARHDAELKDAFLTGRLDDFSTLNHRDALLAGHAFWNYIYQMYGNEKLFTIIRNTQIAQHVDRALQYEVGMSSSELLPEFGNYYKKIYFGDLGSQEDIPYAKLPVETQKDHVYTNFEVSPDGKKFILTDHFEGKTTVWLYDAQTLSRRKIFGDGTRIARMQLIQPLATGWNPKGKLVVIFHETKGELYFSIWNTDEEKLTTRKMPQLDKVQSFSYSRDGARMVLSGIKDGQTDIYVLTVAGNAMEKLTDDLWDDLDPEFLPDESGVIFSSNRKGDTLVKNIRVDLISTSYDIFKYDFRKNRKKSKNAVHTLDRITRTPLENEWQPHVAGPQTYTYLSDRSGTLNLYRSKEDSSILYVDTAVHYLYFAGSDPLTNFSTSITGYQTSGTEKKHYFQVFQNGIYKFYSMSVETEPLEELNQTFFRKKYLQQQDVLQKEALRDSLPKDSIPQPTYRKPDEKPYEINFSKDLVLFQVSNGFLNAAYQRYSGSGYFNSRLNILLRAVFSDLFEDYKIKGAMRVPTNFNTGEFLGSVDFRRSRLDHQVSLFRQGYVNPDDKGNLAKWIIHEARYKVTYPFSETFSLRNTIGYRNDRELFLATSKATLEMPARYYHQGSFKSELVWDNSYYSELNTWKGNRAKAFAEAGIIPASKTRTLLNIGLDLRNAQLFYKDIQWVNRLAGAHSFGSAPIVYYLGGVDNWSIRPAVSFDPNQPVDPSQQYFFQTIATPMRGFIQNARNGNSFFVFNSELRFPLFKVFSDHDVKNEVLRTFQWVFFADAGCSWTGPTPFSKQNHFNTLIIDNKPLEIQLINSREPIVGGIGTGIRTKAFGYFIRFDLGWGIENLQVKNRPVAYFSLGYDI